MSLNIAEGNGGGGAVVGEISSVVSKSTGERLARKPEENDRLRRQLLQEGGGIETVLDIQAEEEQVVGTKLLRNVAWGRGGGLYLERIQGLSTDPTVRGKTPVDTLTDLSDWILAENVATHGAGLAVVGRMDVEESVVASGIFGGAAQIERTETFTTSKLSHILLKSNWAQRSGGGLHVEDTIATLTDVEMSDNRVYNVLSTVYVTTCAVEGCAVQGANPGTKKSAQRDTIEEALRDGFVKALNVPEGEPAPMVPGWKSPRLGWDDAKLNPAAPGGGTWFIHPGDGDPLRKSDPPRQEDYKDASTLNAAVTKYNLNPYKKGNLAYLITYVCEDVSKCKLVGDTGSIRDLQTQCDFTSFTPPDGSEEMQLPRIHKRGQIETSKMIYERSETAGVAGDKAIVYKTQEFYHCTGGLKMWQPFTRPLSKKHLIMPEWDLDEDINKALTDDERGAKLAQEAQAALEKQQAEEREKQNKELAASELKNEEDRKLEEGYLQNEAAKQLKAKSDFLDVLASNGVTSGLYGQYLEEKFILVRNFPGLTEDQKESFQDAMDAASPTGGTFDEAKFTIELEKSDLGLIQLLEDTAASVSNTDSVLGWISTLRILGTDDSSRTSEKFPLDPELGLLGKGRNVRSELELYWCTFNPSARGCTEWLDTELETLLNGANLGADVLAKVFIEQEDTGQRISKLSDKTYNKLELACEPRPADSNARCAIDFSTKLGTLGVTVVELLEEAIIPQYGVEWLRDGKPESDAFDPPYSPGSTGGEHLMYVWCLRAKGKGGTGCYRKPVSRRRRSLLLARLQSGNGPSTSQHGRRVEAAVATAAAVAKGNAQKRSTRYFRIPWFC